MADDEILHLKEEIDFLRQELREHISDKWSLANSVLERAAQTAETWGGAPP